MYKNIEKQAVLQLKDLVEYQTGQVVSKTLVQNDKVSMTIFSFDKGEEISTHAAGGDAMVTVLEGTGKFTVGGEVFLLHHITDFYLLEYCFSICFILQAVNCSSRPDPLSPLRR